MFLKLLNHQITAPKPPCHIFLGCTSCCFHRAASALARCPRARRARRAPRARTPRHPPALSEGLGGPETWIHFNIWLVLGPPLWKMMEFVNWDDLIATQLIYGKIIQMATKPPTRFCLGGKIFTGNHVSKNESKSFSWHIFPFNQWGKKQDEIAKKLLHIYMATFVYFPLGLLKISSQLGSA